MTTITFDRLTYLETLKASGIPEAQARAHAVALDEVRKGHGHKRRLRHRNPRRQAPPKRKLLGRRDVAARCTLKDRGPARWPPVRAVDGGL